MKTWATNIKAINPLDGEITDFCGPNIKAPSKELAFEYCQKNGLGYCSIEGEVLMEIPCDENYKADFGNAINFESENLN